MRVPRSCTLLGYIFGVSTVSTAYMVVSDQPVPLADDVAGTDLEDQQRSIQNGRTYSVTLNRSYLSQLGIDEQGALTVQSLAMRPVIVQNPCIVIQPAEVVDL